MNCHGSRNPLHPSNDERASGGGGGTGREAYLAEFADAVELMSSQTSLVLAVKDAASRHVAATDAYARRVGLRRGGEVVGLLDRELPCRGVARFADDFVAQDARVMADTRGATLRVLNVLACGDVPVAMLCSKSQLRDPATGTALGIVCCCHEIELAPLLARLAGQSGEGGMVWSGSRVVEGEQRVGSVVLDVEDYELCYLLATGSDEDGVAALLDRIRPGVEPRDAADIGQAWERLCRRFGLPPDRAGLREALVGVGVAGRVPATLVRQLIGSSPIDRVPVVPARGS